MTSRGQALPALLLSGMSLFLWGCGGSSGTGPPEPEAPKPTSVSVSPSTATVDAIGSTVQFRATVRDQLNREMTGAAVTWGTSNASVASITAGGLATAVGDGTVTVLATASPSAFGWATMTVASIPLTITTTALPTGVVGLPYSAILEGEGATAPSWSVSAGNLPQGLALIAGTGEIAGIPESAGIATFTVTLAAGDRTAARELTLNIAPGDFGIGLGDDQFVLISPGSFSMGSLTGGEDERPVHTVNITRAFYLQRTEVTQHQWKAVMGSNPSVFSSCGETCPVDGVSWEDVQAFIQALNAANPGKSFRLPTEAEWEYAARAGTAGDFGGTGVLDQMGWYLGNSASRTQFVALKEPNAWGLFDMHGNVMEWVQDYYSAGYYAVSPADDPTGPATGTLRVFRGGSADRADTFARSADRFSGWPTLRGYSCSGFRLARNP